MEKMKLSVCIIAKNEEKNIERCLECIKPYGFEIVVVDTGSIDRTVEIAKKYTSNVYEFEWCNDFSAAKNFAVSKAVNEYVMVVDSDEYLEYIDVKKLFQLLEAHPGQVGRILRKNIFTRNKLENENKEWINRIFSKKLFHYEGKIHEQVSALNGEFYETYQVPVVMSHSGYDLSEEERKKKALRNIVLLKQELECLEKEEVSDKTKEQMSYVLFQLGKGYYMAGDYSASCEYFARGLSYDLNPRLEYVIDMVETYGYALINSGKAEAALNFENIYDEFGNSADFQFLMGLIYMNNTRFEQAVLEFEKAAKHKDCRCKGVNSYLAYYNIGVIYECLGYKEEAKDYYQKCGDYESAKTRLKLLC